MTPEQEYDFYAQPRTRNSARPRRRSTKRLTTPVPVRFSLGSTRSRSAEAMTDPSRHGFAVPSSTRSIRLSELRPTGGAETRVVLTGGSLAGYGLAVRGDFCSGMRHGFGGGTGDRVLCDVGAGAVVADGAAAARPGGVRVGRGCRPSARRGAVDGRVAGRARRSHAPGGVPSGGARRGPGSRGGGQGVRVPRVDALSVAGGGRDLPGPTVRRPAVGAGELGGVLPARSIGLARLQGRGARGPERRTVDRGRARRGARRAPARTGT